MLLHLHSLPSHCYRTLLTFFLVIISFSIFGQTIEGKIVDAASGKPIPLANVFLSGSLIGTTSDIDGNFKLSEFQSGKYDLVVSFVGYDEYITTVDFTKGNMNLTLHVSLQESGLELSEVHITTDTTGRNYNLKLFREYFLGKSENAEHCQITNPEALFLYYDPSENELFAYAKEPLKIDNNALGYGVTYYLKKFQVNMKTGRLESYGVPQFSLLESNKKANLRKWDRKREKAYNGSVVHFFSSLKNGSLPDEGFEVHEILLVPNRERPSEDLINEKLRRFQTQAFSQNKNTQKGSRITLSDMLADSLTYWNNMRSLPKKVDSLGRRIEDTSVLFSKESMKIEYEGVLHVKYNKERERLKYAWSVGRSQTRNYQISKITFLDHIRLYKNLYYEDVRDVFIQGYWGWSTNISESLPLNYSPEEGE